jgi:omega-6 fatty acid desaturase (delta-12 desaturase)
MSSSRDWLALVRRYAQPDRRRALQQLLTLLALVVGLHAAMLGAADAGHRALALLLTLPTACVMVCGFSIQHDCQHGSYFASRRANLWVGRALCLVTLVPNGHHRRLHAVHHATTGHLDRRRLHPDTFPRTAADFDLITRAEYLALPRGQQRLYRFLRHPAVIFTVVPLYLFLFSYRFPVLHPTSRGRGWISTQGTNLAIALALAAASAALGAGRFFAVFGPTMISYTVLGAWLFYAQHQFESTYWRRAAGWDYRDASLYGSSYLALPRPLNWLTGNIGIHHLHHLCPDIPNYRLMECLRDHPALARISRVGAWESLWMLRLALWDEERQQLIGFSQLPERDGAKVTRVRQWLAD